MSIVQPNISIDEGVKVEVPQSGDYTIFWTLEQLTAYFKEQASKEPIVPKIRRQKPKQPRRPYNIKEE